MRRWSVFVFLASILLTGSLSLPQAAAEPIPAESTACAPLPAGVVSWWPGEGDASDEIDNNDGTVGAGTSFASGRVGQAFSFDGVEGHVNIPDGGSGANLDGFTELTIEAWIKPDSAGWDDPTSNDVIGTIVSKIDTTEANGGSYSLTIFNGKLRFVVLQGLKPDNTVGVISTADVPIGSWSHVAGVWHGGTDLEIYLNGTAMAANPFSEGTIPAAVADNAVPVNIGRVESFSGSYVGPAAFFDGLVDEPTVYSQGLSTSEIQAIYTAGSSGKCQPVSLDSTLFLPVLSKPLELLLFDDFSNPSSGWPIADRGFDRFRYVDNEYEMLRRVTGGWSAASAPIADITNYVVSASMRQSAGRNSGYGLIFERIDWEHFYAFIAFPDTQGYGLAKRENGWKILVNLTYSNLIRSGSGSNTLEVRRNGSEISLLINGTVVDTVVDSSYTGSFREVGLYMDTSDFAPSTVRYDNFTVRGEFANSGSEIAVDGAWREWPLVGGGYDPAARALSQTMGK